MKIDWSGSRSRRNRAATDSNLCARRLGLRPRALAFAARSRRGGGWNWVGVVSGLLNPNHSGVGALERRPRHDQGYHEGGGWIRRGFAFGRLVRRDRGRSPVSRTRYRDDAGGGTFRGVVATSLRPAQTGGGRGDGVGCRRAPRALRADPRGRIRRGGRKVRALPPDKRAGPTFVARPVPRANSIWTSTARRLRSRRPVIPTAPGRSGPLPCARRHGVRYCVARRLPRAWRARTRSSRSA